MIPRFCWNACLGTLVCLCLLAGAVHGSAQFTVNCVNPGPSDYPSINSALAAGGNNSYIYVVPGTTCAENVFVGNLTNVVITTDWQSSYYLTGNLTINASQDIVVQGMVVTNVPGNPTSADGMNVTNSKNVEFDFASSVGNPGRGLNIGGASSVTIGDYGTFSSNGNRGIDVGGNSFLVIIAWGGVVDISNNLSAGLNLDRSTAYSYGNTTINNNQPVPGNAFPNGFGITEFGGSKAGIFGFIAPTTIASNQGGGIAIQETSEISLGGIAAGAPYAVSVQDNGPFGVLAEYGSQVTLFGGVQVTGNTTAGVSLYGNSQAAIYGGNQITGNGTGTDSSRAGIQVEQGSQAYVNDATVQSNGGPGIRASAHATLDVGASTFSSNAGGAIVCDSSTALQTDLPHSALGAASACLIPGSGKHQQHGGKGENASLPDWRSAKSHALKVNQLAVQHRATHAAK